MGFEICFTSVESNDKSRDPSTYRFYQHLKGGVSILWMLAKQDRIHIG